MNKVLYETEFLQFKVATKPDDRGEWAYAHRANVKGVVVVAPLIDNERVLFLKTRRPPLVSEGYANFNIELPAGLVGDENINETVEECAEKELEEETGLRAESLEVLTRKLSSSGGCTSEVSSLVLAHIDSKSERSEPGDDNGIIIDRVEVDLKNIDSWLKQQEAEGNTIGAQTLAGLYYILMRRFNFDNNS